MIDLRSDTVTAPTPAMRTAIAEAAVGDDMQGEDPTVNALERRVAELFGHEAALYCVSGSMANLLAVRTVTPLGSEVLCDARAHIVRAEHGAHAAIAGTTSRTWTHPRGLPEAAVIEELIESTFVRTATISVENTHNFGGGAVHSLEHLRDVARLAADHGVALHLDGARIWNAHIASGVSLAEYGRLADVVSVCLSKGLGAPIGSLVIGSADAIAEAREWRARLGGAWRQAGIVAAAGLYALDNHIDRLAEDHRNARLLAAECGLDPATVETNIVVLADVDAPAIVEHARGDGVLVGALNSRTVRLVTHLDVSERDAEYAARVLAKAVSAAD